MFEREIPKYKKKKSPSVSDARLKAKHKHEYKECLISFKGEPRMASYCKICGKIGNVKHFDFVRTESGHCRTLRADEIYRKYRKLEIFEVEDFWQKYINQ